MGLAAGNFADGVGRFISHKEIAQAVKGQGAWLIKGCCHTIAICSALATSYPTVAFRAKRHYSYFKSAQGSILLKVASRSGPTETIPTGVSTKSSIKAMYSFASAGRSP